MANQAFLVCSAERIALPIHHESRFSFSRQVIAVGNWCVPILWMSLFREQDLKKGSLPTPQGHKRVLAPRVYRRFIGKRLEVASSVLQRAFPNGENWKAHVDLFAKAIDRATSKRPYLSIDWTQLDELGDAVDSESNRSRRWILRFFAGARVQSPVARLRQITHIDWDRTFPDPRSDSMMDEDERNLAQLMGNEFQRSLPWWPSHAARPQSKRRVRERTSPKSKTEKRDRSEKVQWKPVEIFEKLSNAVAQVDEKELRRWLREAGDLSSRKFQCLMNEAAQQQDWKSPDRIPDLLLAHGVPVSPQALADIIVNGTAAQLAAVLDRGTVNLSRRIKATGFSRPAPPVSWIVYDQDRKKATRKLKRLIEAGADVDVKCSSGDWLLIESIGEPWATMLIPRASRKHRLAALRYVLEYQFREDLEASRVTERIEDLLKFVRALARSGIEEARGRTAEIKSKMNADARKPGLQPYPY